MHLNLPLSPDLEQFVREQLANGRFQTEDEVVRAALQLLEDQARSQQFSVPQVNQSSENGMTDRPSRSQQPREQLATDHMLHTGTTQRSALRSPRGLIADLRSGIGPDEIKEARSEMWTGLPYGEA